MVAQITEGTAFDKRGRPFRRRNYLPGIIAVAVLFVITALVWGIVLTRPVDVREAAACNAPPTPADSSAPKLGEQVSRSTLIDVAPAKLADTKIRVLNASGQGGQAGDVAGALRDIGFAQPTAANDPVYANARLNCQGQIRFGANGRAGAAAVWLVAPCVELYQDDRKDDTVDLAIGTDFTTLAHSDDIDAVLAGLRPDATEPADSALIAKIHNGTC
ncbi:envelope integrity protein Cei [Candidatus Mycolicibacterium alkanivorans]|uniref:Envelope integrity protein Cei n=1 Tax=Candidatus Mycolicibacterium alkanivorans TaxID=2954114 RepID=A0ABS9YYJ2_9MYCO|nr:envelope integrity protein Cei [Candidatus Mycolicibacterium alkanivorans]MCI4676275.1 envelope integrity protein Cei [Candidatus Mycolicibacterium alkanivorans]